MNLNNVARAAIRRNARWLLRLTALGNRATAWLEAYRGTGKPNNNDWISQSAGVEQPRQE